MLKPLRYVFVLALLLLVGCKSAQSIDRSALDQRYEETQLAEGVLSIVPMRLRPEAQSPIVVNWWYAGTKAGEHQLVYRELTWDQDRKPVGKEQRFRVSQDALDISEPFAYTTNEASWLRLHEAADAIEPPADLPTARQAPTPIESNPIQLPEEPVRRESD